MSAIIFAVALILPNQAEEANKTPLAKTETTPSALVAEATLSTEAYAELKAKEVGLDPEVITDLIHCESSWKPSAKGDNGTSHGLLQFKTPTFEMFSKKYDLTELSIEEPRDQIDLAVRMIKDGYIIHWKNCGKKLGLIK